MKKQRVTLFIVWLCCWATTPLSGDHLEESKIARGKSDTVLSGVDVYHSTMRQVIRKLGPPASSRTVPERGDIVGGKEYEWRVEGARLLLATFNDKEENSTPYSVEVWGANAAGKLGVTGRGLKLGATLDEVRLIYGTRFDKSSNVEGTTRITVQWQDDTTLYIDLDKTGRINYMHLLAEIE